MDGRNDLLALSAVFGGIIQNVQEYLAHSGDVAEHLRNGIVIFQVFQRNAFLLQAAAVHEHGILKFRKQIRHFHVQREPAVLHPGEFQQLLHHAGEAARLPQNDRHAAPGLLGVHLIGRKQGLAPAGDGRQRRAQFVGNRGNEFRLHSFRLADFRRHFIDGIRQLADFIVLVLLNAGAVGAGSNALCGCCDFRYGHQDRTDEKPAAVKNKGDHKNAQQDRQANRHADLLFHVAQAGHIAKHADDLSVGVDHGAGYGHNPLPGAWISPLEGHDPFGRYGLGHIRGLRRFSGPLTVRGGDNLSAGRNELQLQMVLFFKILRKPNAGLIILVIALIDIASKKIRGGSGLLLQPDPEV